MDGHDHRHATAEEQSRARANHEDGRRHVDGSQCVTAHALTDEDAVGNVEHGSEEQTKECGKEKAEEKLRDILLRKVDTVSMLFHIHLIIFISPSP